MNAAPPTQETPGPEEAFARIRLLRSPNIGPATYRALLRRLGDARGALAALPDLAARRGGAGGRYRAAGEARTAEEIAAVERLGARYLFHDSPDYPLLLGQVEGAPPILIARGDTALAQEPTVAMVGARNASAGAMRLARGLAQGLAERGCTVVSGLARGIDTAVHRGALDARGGGTVAVIACGIDIAYPPQNAALQEEVARDGLLLTELPPGTGPVARQFPARNRIIAGLALGTLVVEAAPGSGSLITARLAGDYGREVMAVPGSPLDPRSRGCNALIREGAILVEEAEHVAELLAGFGGAAWQARRPVRQPAFWPAMSGGAAQAVPAIGTNSGSAAKAASAGEAEEDVARAVEALLSTAPVAVDELVRQSGAPTSEVQMALIELELAGRLARHAGGKVSLCA